MKGRPTWLPSIVSVDGVWQEVVSRLYSIFQNDFKRTKPKFQGLPVWWDRRMLKDQSYEEGFWHLITKEDISAGERIFDPRRAERLSWCCPTIVNAADRNVKVWDYKEARGIVRTYIWLEQWDYAIVLEKRELRIGVVAFLITAFYIEEKWSRRKLQNKFIKREV